MVSVKSSCKNLVLKVKYRHIWSQIMQKNAVLKLCRQISFSTGQIPCSNMQLEKPSHAYFWPQQGDIKSPLPRILKFNHENTESMKTISANNMHDQVSVTRLKMTKLYLKNIFNCFKFELIVAPIPLKINRDKSEHFHFFGTHTNVSYRPFSSA